MIDAQVKTAAICLGIWNPSNFELIPLVQFLTTVFRSLPVSQLTDLRKEASPYNIYGHV